MIQCLQVFNQGNNGYYSIGLKCGAHFLTEVEFVAQLFFLPLLMGDHGSHLLIAAAHEFHKIGEAQRLTNCAIYAISIVERKRRLLEIPSCDPASRRVVTSH
ncbi:hypothetical protein AQ949_07035 [Burkholderia pseudomallei]|nr:hypothetical protein ACT79_07660 [Burkholderia pseudomallei]OAB17416.1 hypothetical protein AQ853_21020 [Burkholderia pseudomallei]OMR31947.1 hypothetical protein AQ722_00020 [Burkholderia pseudomallei]OMU47795.1 hypothetical protein AQ776_00110 [Burkholderia pseudomallei]OMU74087.1 hypothetical protein AQ779_01100 [Burkholderia pseudomallei]